VAVLSLSTLILITIDVKGEERGLYVLNETFALEIQYPSFHHLSPWKIHLHLNLKHQRERKLLFALKSHLWQTQWRFFQFKNVVILFIHILLLHNPCTRISPLNKDTHTLKHTHILMNMCSIFGCLRKLADLPCCPIWQWLYMQRLHTKIPHKTDFSQTSKAAQRLNELGDNYVKS